MEAFAAGFVIAQALFFCWVVVLIRRDRHVGPNDVPVGRTTPIGRAVRAGLERIVGALAGAVPDRTWPFEPSELGAYALPADYLAVTGSENVAERENARSAHAERVPHAA